MKIKTRILLSFIVLSTAGFYYLMDFILNEVRPRYQETVEESLNDTANLLASLIEEEMQEGSMNFAFLSKILDNTTKRKISAKIYNILKTDITLSVYVTDEKGIVVYDSDGGKSVGQDFSQWSDVLYTLKGGYGTRTARKVEEDPETSSVFVAAPINRGDRIVGAVTVIKPDSTVRQFRDGVRRKIMLAGFVATLAFIVLGTLLSFWINRPLENLIDYAKALLVNERARPPRISAPEVQELADAFEKMKDDLDGTRYIDEYIESLTTQIDPPLKSILSAAADIGEGRDPKAAAETVQNEARRIDEIVQKMMQLSAVESRQRLTKVSPVNLLNAVGEAIDAAMPQASEKGVSLKNMVDPEAVIDGEPFLVRHAVLNLIQNAVQFTGSGGSVKVTSRENENFILLSVCDNGEGIPSHAIKSIFNRFYSLPGKDASTRGPGLGLSFVREVANLHKGWVEVKNNPDRGVTATLCLTRKHHA